MADEGKGGMGPGGWGPQPGARTTRQEGIETEVKMPRKQAELRAGVDILAALLVIAALLVLGRWVIWLAIFMLLFSEFYDITVDAIVGRLNNPAAFVVDALTYCFKWLWPFIGYAILRVLIPITWTQREMIWQRSVIEFAWPFLFHVAVPWSLPITIGLRIIILVFLIAPLFTWRSLRDSMLWRIEEFTPFGPINVGEQGINPRGWGPRPQPVEVEEDSEGMGVIFETVEGDAHFQQIAEGVTISNGMGGSHRRTDMGWVTEAQWEEVARLLLVKGQPFSEEVLGRGHVFPTHGPWSQKYSNKLGFRFFREQMIEAGRAVRRGTHENSGVDLTPMGDEFLRRRFINGGEQWD